MTVFYKVDSRKLATSELLQDLPFNQIACGLNKEELTEVIQLGGSKLVVNEILEVKPQKFGVDYSCVVNGAVMNIYCYVEHFEVIAMISFMDCPVVPVEEIKQEMEYTHTELQQYLDTTQLY